MRTAEQEFAIGNDREAASEAMLLRDACMQTQSYDWLIALSLTLDDSSSLAGLSSLCLPDLVVCK